MAPFTVCNHFYNEDRNKILCVILMSVQQSTRRHIPEDDSFHSHGRDNPRYLE